MNFLKITLGIAVLLLVTACNSATEDSKSLENGRTDESGCNSSALENDPSRPFIAVHTGILNENLVESELFGHEKGAFTGANETRIGKFEAANGGDIFLDEIATMTPAIQMRFLRVLQEKKVTRLGSNKAIPVNCRVICATNADLEEMVRKGEFRADLYFRVKGLQLNLPPLRDRMEDVQDLMAYFLRKASPTALKGLSLEALEFSRTYQWPGNIRELENAIDILAKITDGNVIQASDLKGQIQANVPFSSNQLPSLSPQNNIIYSLSKDSIDRNYEQIMTQVKQTLTKLALDECNGSILKASQKLGILRTSISRSCAKDGTKSRPNRKPWFRYVI